jgi:hypothetical protein
MYEMDGRTYMMVPAAGTASVPARGAAPPAIPPSAPMGWVAYSLPQK